MMRPPRFVRYLSVLVCAGAFVWLPGCSTDRGRPGPGTYLQTTPLHYRLSTRTYLLHVPPGYDEQKVWPLVLVLHGAFSTARSFEKKSGFSTLADRAGFVVAYPNGVGVLGLGRHWNAGHCCGLAEKDHVDDIGFLDYMLDDIARRLPIDPQRVFLVGHSNGGMLAYEYASRKSARIAALCVVSGTIGSARGKGAPPYRTGPPERAVPLLAIHGRQDRCVPFAGGLGLRSGGRYYVPVLDSVGLWARYCGCGPTPEVSVDPHGGRSLMTWRDMQGAPWAVLCLLENWEHAWPGTFNIAGLPPDHPLRGFEASQVIWEFFCQHPRNRSLRE